MVKKKDLIKEKVRQFYLLIKDIYSVKKVFIYGSYAKGKVSKDSDIDVGVVVDKLAGSNRINITASLFHYAAKVDYNIEPRCIFWDEYQKPEKASILSEILKSRKDIPLI
ncbi:MAG: nucleotidyltransferase domain-containing protein [Candidatus Hydrogenedentota bacterium]